MMIKVGNEFLDFDGDIEMEKQIKLFEDISTTDGDYSYSFELEKSIHNTRLLQNPFPDNISKPVYQRIPAQLLGDSGAVTYEGYIRVQRITDVYECSFFSGNNNWFGMIDGLLSDIDFSYFDIEQTESNIIDSWSQSEGIIYPFLDNGALITRYFPQLKIEDFVGAFYIKTIFQKVFTNAGIKIQGELLQDWHYNNSLCLKSSKDQIQIDARSSYVLKGTSQVLAHEFFTKVTYTDDFTYPYNDGSLNLFDLPNSQFVADVKMKVRVESTLSYHTTGGGNTAYFNVYIGVNTIFVTGGHIHSIEDAEVVNSFSKIVSLNAGDILEIYGFQKNNDSDAGTITGGTVKITPIYIYKTFGSAAVPNWTSQQFVSNVLRIFNVLPSYNAGTATLTLNMFEKVRAKPPLDLSEYITDTEIDYQEFVSDYARKSRLTYQQIEFEELKSYNQGKYFKYGQGLLNVNNGFLEEEKEILKSDFANPVDYILPVFSASVTKTNVIELEEAETVSFDDVADDGSGNAAFHILSNPFAVGDLIRISNSSNNGYNGDLIVRSIPAGHVVTDLPFDTAATGDISKLNYKYSNDDDVFIMLNAPNYPVTSFSGAQITFETETYPLQVSAMALVWFNMISTGVQANHDFIYSLSFGRVDDPLAYQVPLIETHFRLFAQVLNDPVKLISTALVPYDVYMRIDFLRPITIRTFETTNQYYLNRVTGYKESYLDCQLELIKLPGFVEQMVGEVRGGATSGEGGGPAEDPDIPSAVGFPYIFDFQLS